MSSELIFDTETTDRKNGEIIECAWLRFKTWEGLLGADPDVIPPSLQTDDAVSHRFKPSKPSTLGALAVHHILPSELEGCPTSSSFALPEDTTYLIGHSIDFDWEAAGSPAHVKRICTHALAQHVWPDATGYSQTALIYMLKGQTPETRQMVREAHGAIADVYMNKIILQAILDKHHAVTTWSQLWALSEECRIPRTCPMKRYEGVLLEDLEEGFIYWCLGQSWLDRYFRTGLERVLASRHGPANDEDEDADVDDADGADVDDPPF